MLTIKQCTWQAAVGPGGWALGGLCLISQDFQEVPENVRNSVLALGEQGYEPALHPDFLHTHITKEVACTTNFLLKIRRASLLSPQLR